MSEIAGPQTLPRTSAVDRQVRSPDRLRLSSHHSSALEAQARAAPAIARPLGDAVVHDDANAARLAESISARAFTVGNEVFVDRRQAGLGTDQGRRLLAHELAHVEQQRTLGRWIQRDDLPDFDLLTKLNSMSDEQLHKRHDDIVAVLAKATQSTPENVRLEKEVGEIGAILARRAGRTFAPDDIAKMRKFFEANAKKAKPESCIATLNDGMKTVLKDPKQKVASSVDETAARLQASKHAGAVKPINFNDAKGRPTTGTLSPVSLRESVWDAVVSMAGGDQGWSVFVMSLVDGYHSVTLSLDNTDPTHRKIYWSDQWGTKGGFKEFDKAGLDGEVERLTHQFWELEASGNGPAAKKRGKPLRMNSILRLYRVLGTPHPVTTPSTAPSSGPSSPFMSPAGLPPASSWLDLYTPSSP